MRKLLIIGLVVATALSAARGETVRLKATADIWLSDANEQERDSSAGKCSRFKLKSIQEMAAIRFDAAPAKGREILGATRFLRRASGDMLRYVRVSTISQDWAEGGGTEPYGPADGATYRYADAGNAVPWAWPGAEFCDVIMTSGHTLATWAERKERPDGWIAAPLGIAERSKTNRGPVLPCVTFNVAGCVHGVPSAPQRSLTRSARPTAPTARQTAVAMSHCFIGPGPPVARSGSGSCPWRPSLPGGSPGPTGRRRPCRIQRPSGPPRMCWSSGTSGPRGA